MVGLIPDEPLDGKFRKRNIDPKNIDTINRHLAQQREIHMSADEKQTTAEDLKINVPPYNEEVVCNMLQKHEPISSGQLFEINATELLIDLKQEANPPKSPPYQAVPKTRELARSIGDKQTIDGRRHRTRKTRMGSTDAVRP